MDPTWLASLFGPNALDTSAFTGGTLPPTFNDRYDNLLPFTTPTVGAGGQGPTPPIVPSATPTAPSGAGVPQPPPAMPAPPSVAGPPAMPPGVGPPAAPPGLMNQAASPNADRILAALRGVPQIAPPDVVKPTTPHPPATHAIAPANLANLFASLGISPQQLPTLRR